MNALKTAGERLGRYALAKRQAVTQEDFNVARLRKEQIEMYKVSVLEKLQVSRLLEKDGLNPENDSCSETYSAKPTLPSPPSLQDVASHLSTLSDNSSKAGSTSTDGTEPSQSKGILKHEEPPNSPQLNLIGRSPNRGSPNTGSLRRRNKSAPRNNHDEDPIPTLRQ
jgi:centrosomal protein CEP104